MTQACRLRVWGDGSASRPRPPVPKPPPPAKLSPEKTPARLRATAGYGFVAQMESPCNQTCKIDPQSGYCLGCGRDMDEIQQWPHAGEVWHRQILSALPARLALIARASACRVADGDQPS